MKKTKNAKRIMLFIGLVSMSLSLIACGTSDKPAEAQKSKGQMMKSVEVVEAQKRDIAMTLNATGTVEPDTLVTVISQVEGELVFFPFKEGDEVKKGQVIAKIDDKEMQAQITQAEADLEYAQARLKAISAGARPQEIEQAAAQVKQMQATLESVQKDLQHTKELYFGPIPRQELENAEGKQKNTLAQLESVKVRLDGAKRELERTKQLFELGAVAVEKVEQAQTNYNTLLAQLHAAQAEVENAEANLKNTKELYELETIPRQKIDNAEAKFFIAAAQLQAAQEKLDLLKAGPAPEDIEVAKAQVKQSSAKLAYMNLKSKYYTITAPINGTVTERFVNQGDVASQKQKLLVIADISNVLVISGVSELEISKVKQGEMVSVSVDAYPFASLEGRPDAQFSGKVTRIHPVVEGKARSVPVEIRLPNPDKKLLPGMFARVIFMVAQHENVVLLPADAIVTEEGKTIAFVVRDAQVHATPIKVGIRQGNKVEIASGVNPGDKVVITGQSELKDGMKVTISSGQGKRTGMPGKNDKGGSGNAYE